MAVADRIFAAVFPPPSDVDIPTPAVTPLLGSSSFDDASGTLHLSHQPLSETSTGGAAEQIKWDRAWHTATTFLSLVDQPIYAAEGEERVKRRFLRTCDTETRRALEYLLSDASKGRQLRKGHDRDNLLRWYFEVVVEHYVKHMLPLLVGEILEQCAVPDGLFDVGKHLYLAQMVYLYPIKAYVTQFLPHGGEADLHRFETYLNCLFIHTLPNDIIEDSLATFFRHQASIVLDVDRTQYAPQYAEQESLDPMLVAREREKTCSWMSALQSVGLGGHQAQRIFAEVMSEILTAYVRATFTRQWDTPSRNEQYLNAWIEHEFSGFIAEVLEYMQDEAPSKANGQMPDAHADVEKWQEMGIHRLGVLRLEELFEVVVEWDDDVQGAIEDLKLYVKTPSSRIYLTNTFSSVIQHRLLQPGASTKEILQVYISIIKAFTLLDPKGILLDRVARPIRRYLREREDTVSIVVGGLLADPEDSACAGDALVELAIEMAKQNSLMSSEDADLELDYDDMEWMPDPVDAGPEYKKSKNSDVIGSLVSLFESKDVFIREFQKILGERLLRKEYEFDREIRVLELLKVRFGEAALQACEVMLRDIQDSRRIDASIQKDQDLRSLGDEISRHPETVPRFHARILSHLFWPSLHSEIFHIPHSVIELQHCYATGFETIKQSRKLTWLPALGQVTVTLDLEDRHVTEEVQTWQASVIYAFQHTDEDDSSHPVTRTVPELIEKLEMTESLVLNAVTFWVGKLVLKAVPNEDQTYTVLENLSHEPAAQSGTTSAAVAAAAETATAAAAPAVLSEHEVVKEKMEVYAQYVVGMLTNGGAMPLQQIVMMLKLTVPGGFPFGSEDLKGFLEGEVRDGRLDYAGGCYKIKH
ncbi:MAG: hypothetical protein Q9217_000478 [Psora testacea]